MTVKRLEKGMVSRREFETDASMAADRFHERSPVVLSTASLIGIMQTACAEVMSPFLAADEMVVSVRVEISHFGAVPAGTRLSLQTEIADISGRQVSFKVEASDGRQTIASGKNDMFIIDRQRFESGIERYKNQTGRVQ